MVIAFDLDDTLYHEMDYVHSAYRAIADKFGRKYYQLMMAAPTPADAFDATGIMIEELLHIYRHHFPDITLPMSSLYTLAALKKMGHTLALITDGRTSTQYNKIVALGLDRLISPDMIYVSEKFGQEKITGGAMRDIMAKRPGCRYMYVGDNLVKDFVRGNEMGWVTVCLKASSVNIFPQNFENIDSQFLPKKVICNLYELLDLARSWGVEKFKVVQNIL